MSAGHKGPNPHSGSFFENRKRATEQYDGLLHQPWFQLAMSQPYEINTFFDLPYVAGASTTQTWLMAPEGMSVITDMRAMIIRRVYIDRHAYRSVMDAGLLPGLCEHELVEAVLEEHGWTYDVPPNAAHEVACVAEDRKNMERGITRSFADSFFAPLIKSDEHERIQYVPRDLIFLPYIEPPIDESLVLHMRTMMLKEKKYDQSTAGR